MFGYTCQVFTHILNRHRCNDFATAINILKLFVTISNHLNLEVLTQFPASNDEKDF